MLNLPLAVHSSVNQKILFIFWSKNLRDFFRDHLEDSFRKHAESPRGLAWRKI